MSIPSVHLMEDEICDLLFLFGDDTDPLFNVEAEDEVIQDNTAEVRTQNA